MRHLESTEAEAELSIVLDGVFDGPAARRLEARILGAQTYRKIRVDLSKVREFQDFALGILAHVLSRVEVQVVVRGLRQHQLRMLRYFGLSPEAVARTAVDAA
jgi:anti-anti-sigma regulatory factor